MGYPCKPILLLFFFLLAVVVLTSSNVLSARDTIGKTLGVKKESKKDLNKDSKENAMKPTDQGLEDDKQRFYYDRPFYGRPIYGRPVYGRPVYGRPVYGEGRGGYAQPIYGGGGGYAQPGYGSCIRTCCGGESGGCWCC